MKKLILGPLLGLLCVLPLFGMSTQDEGDVTISDAASTRLAELEEDAKEAYSVWLADLRKKMAAAKEAGEELPSDAYISPYKEFIPSFEAAAADYAGTEDAVPFLMWVAQRGMQADAEAGKRAMLTLFETHTASPGLAPMARSLSQLGRHFEEAKVTELLTLLSEQSTVPAVRGWAGYGLLADTIENAELETKEFESAKLKAQAIAKQAGDDGLINAVESAIGLREKFSLGMVAPDISGVDLDGVEFKLSDYTGKVIFLDFWGDW